MRSTLRIIVLLVASLAYGVPPVAQGQTPVAGPPHAAIDPPAQLMLIRNTLALVNHGNLTGNYTVLRDLSSSRFHQRNTAADLAATFANLRLQKLDLSPILVIEPMLSQPPAEISPGRVQFVGQFATRPQAVDYALVFQQVDAGWLIDEISLRVAPAESRPPTGVRSPAPTPAAYPQTGLYNSPPNSQPARQR